MSSLQVSVTAGKSFVADEVITYEKLNQLGVPVIDFSGSITEPLLTDGSVSTNKLASDAVTTGKVLDNNITLAKLQSATAGDILYWDNSGNPQVLAKGTNGQVLTLASGLPSWAAAASQANLADDSVELSKLKTTGAPTNSVPVYTAGSGVAWTSRLEYGHAHHWHTLPEAVQFELDGTDAGAGSNAYIQNRTDTNNSVSGIENLSVTTDNDWSWVNRKAKIWGLGLTYNKNYLDFNGSNLGSPVGDEDDKYFHSYEFTIGNVALAAARGDSTVTVDDTSSLIFEISYSLPFHGMALFQRSHTNSAITKLLWMQTSSPYDGWKGGGQQLNVGRLEMDTHGQPYNFRLIYWETGTTPSDRPLFNMTLVGHTAGKQVTGS